LSQLTKVSDDKLELAILPGLGGEVGGSDCGKALQAARDMPPAKAASVFATNCPPPGVRRAIDPAKLESVPLWAGAIAVLLELHDRSAKADDSPLSAAIRDALLN